VAHRTIRTVVLRHGQRAGMSLFGHWPEVRNARPQRLANGILELGRRGGPAPVREYREFCREVDHGTLVHGIANDRRAWCGRDILSAYACKRRDACRASDAQGLADIGVCLSPQAAQRCHMEFRQGGKRSTLAAPGARLVPASALRPFSQIAPRLPRRSKP